MPGQKTQNNTEGGKKRKARKILKVIGIAVLSVCLAFGLAFGGYVVYTSEARPGPTIGGDAPVGPYLMVEAPTESDLAVLSDFILKNYYEDETSAGFVKNDFVPSYYRQYYIYRLLNALGEDGAANAFLERIRPDLSVSLSVVKENKSDPVNFCFYLYLCAEAGVEIPGEAVVDYLRAVTKEDGLIGNSAKEITTAYYLEYIAPRYDLSEFGFGEKLAAKAAETQFLPYSANSKITFYNSGGAVLYACGVAGVADEIITQELRDWLSGWSEYFETDPEISVIAYRNYLDVKCLFAPVTEPEQARLQTLYDSVADAMEGGDLQGLYYYVPLFSANARNAVRDRAVNLSENERFGGDTISVENTFYGFLLNQNGADFNTICNLNYEKMRNTLPLFLQSAEEDLAAKKYISAIKKTYYTAYLDWHLSQNYFTGKTPLYQKGQTEVYMRLIDNLLKKLNTLSDGDWIECQPLLCKTASRITNGAGGVSRYRYRKIGRRFKKIYKALQKQPDSTLKVSVYSASYGFGKYGAGDLSEKMADIYEALAIPACGMRSEANDALSADIYSTFSYLTNFQRIAGSAIDNGKLLELCRKRDIDPKAHCCAFADKLYRESGILFPAEAGGIPTLRSVYEGVYLYLT